jgi:hypothetical protein
MLLPSGEPKLMDFGIATIETARLQVTGSGQFFGTPLYMAPETARDRHVDARADLFSLGTVCYELLTGCQAFAAGSIPAIVARIEQEDPTPPSKLVTEIPGEVDQLVAHILAKEPSERFPSARALVEDLDDLLAGRCARHSAAWWTGLASLGADAAGPDQTKKFDPQPLLSVVDVPQAKTRSPSKPPTLTAATATGVGRPAYTRGRSIGEIAAGQRRTLARARLAVNGTLALVVVLLSLLVGRSAIRPPSDNRMAALAPTSDRIAQDGKRSAFDGTAPLTTPIATSAAAATPAVPLEPSARLLVDLEHPLKSGRVRLWISGKLALDRSLRGQTEKKLKIIKVQAGDLEDTLKLSPGRHQIEVAVNWDENEKRQRISGLFGEGQAKHLEIRLSRLSKNLSLDWR